MQVNDENFKDVLPDFVKHLVLNISQENFENFIFPNEVETLEIKNIDFINHLPKKVNKLIGNYIKSIDTFNLPMLETLILSFRYNSEEINLDFLPCSLKYLSLKHDGTSPKKYDLTNLPNSLRKLKLENIEFNHLPKNIEFLHLKNLQPNNHNMNYSNLKKLKIIFCFGFIDCTLTLNNIDKVKIIAYGKISTIIHNNVKNLICNDACSIQKYLIF